MPVRGFETVSNVKQYQEDLNNLIGYTNTKSRTTASNVLKQTRSRLQSLYDILIAQEKQFFEVVGVKSYEELLNKINDWNLSGADVLLNNSEGFTKLVEEIRDEILTKDFEERIKIAIDRNDNISNLLVLDITDKEDVIEDITRRLIEGLTKAAEKIEKTGFRWTVTGKKSITDKNIIGHAGVLRYVLLNTVEAKDGKLKYEVHFEDDTPSRYKRRIYDILEEMGFKEIRKVETSAVGKSKEVILNSILSRLSIKGNAARYIAEEVRENFIEYGMNKSSASIKGALGEIYWTAFFKFISNGTVSVSPVGMKRILEGRMKGQQIPIDIVLSGLGFQVKNYHIDNNKVNFRNKLSLNGFIYNRLNIDATPFENFYFSWGYNKVAHTAHAELVYRPLFERFDRIMQQMSKNLENFIYQYLDKILRLDTEFYTEAIEGFSNNNDLKINTAFLISNKVIFSSDIVAAILKMLDNGEAEVKFENFDITYTEPFAPPFWEYDKEGNNKINPEDLMKTTKIAYEVSLDVGKLVEIAISRLK